MNIQSPSNRNQRNISEDDWSTQDRADNIKLWWWRAHTNQQSYDFMVAKILIKATFEFSRLHWSVQQMETEAGESFQVQIVLFRWWASSHAMASSSSSARTRMTPNELFVSPPHTKLSRRRQNNQKEIKFSKLSRGKIKKKNMQCD